MSAQLASVSWRVRYFIS